MDKVKMPVKCRARMDRWVRYLEATEPKRWTPELIKPLKWHDGIYELRIECLNVEYRPLGCFGPHEKQFTLLIGAIEKDSKFIPLQAPETAKGADVFSFIKMGAGPMNINARTKLMTALQDKEYRVGIVEEHISTGVPFQIRAMREAPEREWTQKELGEKAEMAAERISVLEDPKVTRRDLLLQPCYGLGRSL